MNLDSILLGVLAIISAWQIDSWDFNLPTIRYGTRRFFCEESLKL